MIRSVLAGLAAFGLALASSALQRHGPDQAIFCALGKSVDGYDIYCPRPVLNAGWPAPYLFDRAGISVEDRISWFEDDVRIWPLLADVAFFWLLLRAAAQLARSASRRR